MNHLLVKKEFIIFITVIIAGAALLAFIYFNVYTEKGERAFYWGGADSGEYLALADNVLAGRGFSIHRGEPFEIGSTRTPGYPFVVAFAKLIGRHYGVFLLIFFQIATLGAIGVLSHRIFKKFLNEGISFFLSFFVVFHPQMLLITFSIMSDIFFIFFFLFSFYYFLNFLERGASQALWNAAFLLGLATVIRPGGLLIFLMYLLFLLPRLWRAFLSKALLRNGAIIASAAVLFLLPQIPWSLRNYGQFGTLRPTPADTYNLYFVMLPTIIAERDGISREAAQGALHEELVRFPGFTRGRAHDTFAYTAVMDQKIKEVMFNSPFLVVQIVLREIPILLLQAEWARPLDKWRIVSAASENISLRHEAETRGLEGAIAAIRQKIMCGSSCFLPSFAIFAGMAFWSFLFIFAAAGVVALFQKRELRDPAIFCMMALIAYVILLHAAFINVPEIAERYKLPVLPFLMIFAVFGWRGIRDFGRRITPQVTVL